MFIISKLNVNASGTLSSSIYPILFYFNLTLTVSLFLSLCRTFVNIKQINCFYIFMIYFITDQSEVEIF